mmetsp:Transcript_9762/g.21123  ORF Transcript_9762/g.21123 Transcript_9762/m.21123 type:complete len:252 (-) Transcript_9762:193-948(-)
MVKGSSALKLNGSVDALAFASSSAAAGAAADASGRATAGWYFSGSKYIGVLAQTAISASMRAHGDFCHRSDASSTMSVHSSTYRGQAQVPAFNAAGGPLATAPGIKKNTGLGDKRLMSQLPNFPSRSSSSWRMSAKVGATHLSRGTEMKTRRAPGGTFVALTTSRASTWAPLGFAALDFPITTDFGNFCAYSSSALAGSTIGAGKSNSSTAVSRSRRPLAARIRSIWHESPATLEDSYLATSSTFAGFALT